MALFVSRTLSAVLTAMMLLLLLVSAAKPIRNLEVQLRGQVYLIQDVTTVSELQERLQEATGWSDPLEGAVSYKGKNLKPTDVLRKVGVKEGAKLTLIPGERESKTEESNIKSQGNLHRMRSHEFWEDAKENERFDFHKFLDFLRVVNSAETSILIRDGMEKLNSHLQSGWQKIKVKQGLLANPIAIENIRQEILKNPELAQNLTSSGFVIDDPEAFQGVVGKLSEVGIKAIDEIINAVLEVVLDFLKGAVIRKEEEEALAAMSDDRGVDITNVLFELSESEDEF